MKPLYERMMFHKNDPTHFTRARATRQEALTLCLLDPQAQSSTLGFIPILFTFVCFDCSYSTAHASSTSVPCFSLLTRHFPCRPAQHLSTLMASDRFVSFPGAFRCEVRTSWFLLLTALGVPPHCSWDGTASNVLKRFPDLESKPSERPVVYKSVLGL